MYTKRYEFSFNGLNVRFDEGRLQMQSQSVPCAHIAPMQILGYIRWGAGRFPEWTLARMRKIHE